MMTIAPPPRLGYVKALDGVRAIAVVAVLVFHVYEPRFKYGFNGVTVFFVLSGFLITTTLIEEWRDGGAINLGKFYRRRALRLLPAATLMVLVSLLPFNPGGYRTRGKSALVALVYLSNWAEAFHWTDMRSLSHTWSLAIEEQFYLLWPLLLILLLKFQRTRTRIVGIVGAGVVLAIALRLLLVWAGSSPDRLYRGLDTRADELLIGCLAAVGLAFCSDHPILRSRRTRGVLAVLLMPLAIFDAMRLSWFDRQTFVTGIPVVETLAMLLIVTLVVERESMLSRAFEMPALVWVGRLSYSLYLWHWLVLRAFDEVDIAVQARRAIVIALSFSAAAFSYYAVERPFLRLKARFAPHVKGGTT